MKIFRIVLFLLIALITLQMLTFNLWGKKTLMNHLIKNYKTYLIDRNVANCQFCTNINYSSNQIKNLKQVFNASSINIISKDEFYNKDLFPLSYNYLAWAEFKFSSIVNFSECERFRDFIAVDKSEYIWILVTWIKVKKENIGIT